MIRAIRAISASLIVVMLAASINVFAAESTEVYDGVISVAEYDNGWATIAGQVPAPQSRITVQVLDRGADFGELNDANPADGFSKLIHIQQITAGEDGRFRIKWEFPKAADGVYPVRVYSAAEDKAYTAQLKIGEANVSAYETNYWYEDENGNPTVSSAAWLVIEVKVKETEGSARDISILAAKYEDRTDVLCDVYHESAKAFGNADTVIVMKVPLEHKNYHMKVFVWDGMDNQRPLGKIMEFDTNAIIAADSNTIYSDMLTHLGGTNVHPRVLANRAEFDHMVDKVNSNPVMKTEYNQLVNKAGKWMKRGELEYKLEGGYALLDVSRELVERVRTYATLYMITDDDIWAQRTWHELETCMNFPDWNPYHFLDVGEMAYGFAVGYDWLYDWLSEEQKLQLAQTVKNYAFDPIMDDYLDVPTRQRTFYWSRPQNSNNWNLVCNGGVMTAALAFMDVPEVADSAKQVLDYGMKSILNGLALYGPTGDWEEGVTYWCYASKYLGWFLSSLEATTGTEYGYSSAKGLKESINWVMAMQGPTMSFNFGETEDSIKNQSNVYWFGHQYGDENMIKYARSLMQNNSDGDQYEILYYDGNYENAPVEYPEDYFGEKLATATMRSGSGKTDTFVGFHNGKNNISHSQFDAGQFVIDSQGQRFIKDLGKDNYDLPKWQCYRNRAEGHNTLVINPSSGNDQYLNADCPLLDYDRVGDTSYAISNLTSAYINDANSVKRGVMLTDNRQTVIVRDEINLKKASELYWFAHTDAKVTVSADKKSAVLALNGKYMLAQILPGSDGEFTVMDPKPLSTSPNPSGQASNSGCKLAIHLTNYTQGTIEVGFAPISSAAGSYAFTSPGELNTWKNK